MLRGVAMRALAAAMLAVLLLASAAGSRPTPVTRILQTLAFSSPQSGYGLVDDEGARTCVDRVGLSGDGGARFALVGTVAAWRCAGGAPVAQLAFDGRGDGFAYGPGLFVSHDGGRSWARSPQPGSVLAVSALGESVWMVEEDCARGRSLTCPMALLESADGGRTWRPAPRQPPGALAARYGEPALGQDWLVRVSAGTAYVLSSPPRGALYVPLWSTSDGGASWAARRIPCGGALSVVASVAPDGALVAVCAGEPGAGSQAKWSAASTDGGRTWSVHPRCEIIACQPAALVGGYLGEVDAVSASTFYVIGDRSPLIVTRDGGVSWRRYDDVGNVNGLPAQVQFFGPRDGIVLGQSNTSTAPVTIWHTDDAGANWTAVTPTFSG
jgi:hypothetical protein